MFYDAAANNHSRALGRGAGVHIADQAIVEGRVDVTRLKPIARLSYGDYVMIDEVFTLGR